MNREELLFVGRPLSDFIFGFPQALRKEVEAVDRNTILNASAADVAAAIAAKFFFDIPRLKRDEAHLLDPRDTKVDVSHDFRRAFREPGPHYMQGTLFTLVVPFDGDGALFKLQPSRFSLSGVRAAVEKDRLMLHHEQLEPNAEAVKKDFDSRLKEIESYLQTQSQDVHEWNAKLPDTVRSLLEERKKKILASLSLTESLGFPMKRRPDTTPVPVTRKRVVVQMPTPKSSAYVPEPALTMEGYEDILQAVSSLSLTMERSPSAFATMGEEHLRDHILVTLNCWFEGQATGETFNRDGKTDILIRVKDRNIFIGECKFWDGPKTLTDAVDQVLGYTCWRDTKVAVIVFNRRKDISAVLAAIPKAVSEHPCCKKQIEYKREGGFRFLFGQKDDRNRELTLTVLVFNVPSSASAVEPAPKAKQPPKR